MYNPNMVTGLSFLAELQPIFDQEPAIVLAYLFGSYARGQANSLSDVDIAILLKGQPSADQCFEIRMDMMGRIMDRLQMNEVDVAILNQASLALRYRVLRDGKLLFCRDENARIAFTAQTVSRYLDFKPIIDLFDDAILIKAQKGELTRGYNPYRGALERYRRRYQSIERTSNSKL
jgi:predicted nucleotidyltransferase